MKNRKIDDYLQDILEAISAIETFTKNVKFEQFSQNLEKVFAVSIAIEIVGEAAK
jgi:uncharacterized protein with HEPN domain